MAKKAAKKVSEPTLDLGDFWIEAEVAERALSDSDDGVTQEELETMLDYKIVMVKIDDLTPHPQNYQTHPPDQLEHLIASIKRNGFYKNIVVARDNMILAGHGVVKALKKMGITRVPIYKLDIDPFSSRALKLLIGDNEISHLAEVDDRALSEVLKTIQDTDADGLFGTGFDQMMLANLIYVTRSSDEIENFDEAGQWVGMPEYEIPDRQLKVSVLFRNEEDRARFAEQLGLEFTERTVSTWWPAKAKADPSSLRFEEGAA